MVNYSIQQGMRASRAKVVYFKHNDINDLEQILEEFKAFLKNKKCSPFIVIEGLYINSGRICNLPKIVSLMILLKEKFFQFVF